MQGRRLSDTELEVWLKRGRESGKPTGMSVSCPICWLPILINGNGATREDGCPCGTIATQQEVKEAFGVGHLSAGIATAITARD